MLDVALKEWAVVCDLMLEGRLALLLRKGGIHEWSGPGRFELEHDRFALYPSWAHQKPDMLKPPLRQRVEVLDEPDEITFRGIGEVTRVWQVTDRAVLTSGGSLDDLHPWSAAHIDMRFNYKPDRPLYLLAVRVSALREPKTVPNQVDYAGCKSWVPLRPGDEVDDTDAQPTLTDAAFDLIVAAVNAAFG